MNRFSKTVRNHAFVTLLIAVVITISAFTQNPYEDPKKVAQLFSEAFYIGNYEEAKKYASDEMKSKIERSCPRGDCSIDSLYTFNIIWIHPESNEEKQRYAILWKQDKAIYLDVDFNIFNDSWEVSYANRSAETINHPISKFKKKEAD